MAYTPNPTWVDGTSGTLITAAKLNSLENGLALAASVADAALPKVGGTLSGALLVNDAKITAGTTTDVLGSALEVKRNNVVTGRLDNNANGLRLQAITGTLQLRGTGDSGVSIDGSGNATFAGNVTLSTGKVNTAGLGTGTADGTTFLRGDGTWAAPAAGGAGVSETLSPRIGDFLSAPDIKQWVSASGQPRLSGVGPYLSVSVAKTMTFDALACQVDTLEAGSTIRLGLYSCDANGFPTTLLGSVSCSGASTGQQTATFTSPIVLTAGTYGLVARMSSSTALRLRCVVTSSHSAVGAGSLAVGDNFWVGANFGTSTTLTNVSSYTFDFSDHTALIGMRRSA